MVISARGRGVEYSEHESHLSLKTVFSGREHYGVGGLRYVVDQTNYLLVNHGERYSSRIGAAREADSFSIFFERRFASETLRALAASDERLLDDPRKESSVPVEFYQTLYPRVGRLSALLTEMRGDITRLRADALLTEEKLHQLVAYLFESNLGMVLKASSLGAVRFSTRLEQYRRTLVARDFIEGNLVDGVRLAEVAAASCLSPFHLLRLFKEAFAETPHQYLTRRRLERARHLLASTTLPIWRIGHMVGFESPSFFSRLVSKHLGASPRELRRRLADADSTREEARSGS